MTQHSAMVTLPSDTQILITREFDAPRHLVYRVTTEPELVRRGGPATAGRPSVSAPGASPPAVSISKRPRQRVEARRRAESVEE